MSVTMESAVFMGRDLVKKELSIFSAQRSTSVQILYCVLVRYKRTPNRTMHGNKDWSGSKHLKFTETLTESTVSRRNSSGTSSQDSIRCSSMTLVRHERISQEELYS